MRPALRHALRWTSRLLAALAVLLLLLVATSPWTVPRWLRSEIPLQGRQQLGRIVRVGALAFNPLRLRLQVDDLQVLDAAGRAAELHLRQGVVRLDWSSLWGLHPRVGALRLQGLRLHVVRARDGRLSFEDVLRRLGRRPAANPAAGPAQFGVDLFELDDGSVLYDDQASGVHTALEHLNLRLTDLSTLGGADGALHAQAHGRLDGAPLQLRVGGTLYGAHPALIGDLQLQGLALGDWRELQPADLPVRLHAGQLDTTLHLQWPLRGSARPLISGQIRLRELSLRHAGQPLLQMQQVDVPVVSLMPLQRELQLGVVEMQGLRAQVDRAQWAAPGAASRAPAVPASAPRARAAPAADPAAATAPKTAPKTAPTTAPASAPASAPSNATTGAPKAPAAWQLRVAGARLRNARIHWHDALVRPVVDWDFDIPDARVGPAAWPVQQDIQAQASLQGPRGLVARVSAVLGARQDTARLQLQGLDASLAGPYAAPMLRGSPLPTGTLQARLDVQWKSPALRIDLPEAQWQAFSWQPTGALRGDGPRAHAIRLRDAQLQWQPGPGGLRLRIGELDVDQPATGPGAGVRAAAVQVRDARIEPASHRVLVKQLSVLQPQASLARDSSGAWSAGELLPAGLLPAPPAHRTPAVAPAAAATPWSVQLADARVRGGSAYLADTYPAQPVVLSVTGIDAELRQAQWPMRDAASFDLQARVRDARQAPPPGASAAPGGGTLRLGGQLRAAPWRVHARLHAQDLPAQVAAEYLPPLNARLLRASASADGTLDIRLGHRGPRIGFDGQAELGDVAANTVQPDASLLGWQALQLQGLRVQLDPRANPRTRVDVRQVLLRDFHARLALSREARLNMAEVLRPAARAPTPSAPGKPAATAPAAPATTGSAPVQALRLRIGGITLEHGRVNWSDHFVQPNYSASLTQVNGHIGAFASDSPAQAAVDLRAVAEGTAPVSLAGKVNPLLSPPQLDLRARVDDLQLAPLTPYSTRYAGYGIERGLLSMNVHYDIDAAGKLQADNQLVLRQLTFGPHVPSPTATKLPVLLAVDLLKDRDGNIHLDIPISGSLHDPEFSLGAVIAQAVGKLLLRAITAPFSLMAHMFAGGKAPPQLNVVPFAAGSARAAADATARLQDIARLLKAKPGLVVTITGRVCGATEAGAYREAVLERQLLAQWRSDLPRAEAYAHAKDTRVPAAAREQALAALYRGTALPDKPRNALGFARSVPPATMQQLLLRAIPDDRDHLQALAMRRAVALRDALNELGVPAVRQFIAAPEVLGAAHKDCQPSASLSVSLP
jgi:hypothetical protein